MGEKDLTEKVLLSYKDVFADIVNVLIFHGDPVISPEDLTDEEPHSYYYSKEHIYEQAQDVVKTWRSGQIQIACIGFENQTQADSDMIFRVFGYEGARYRMQLNSKSHDRYPVLTLVLYYGVDHRWDKAVTLHQRLEINSQTHYDELKKYVNDYKLNVFDIAYLTPQTVQMFQSDFRIVADYFVQMRTGNDYIPSDIELAHIKETLHLLAAVTDDDRFETDYINFEKEAPKNMCEVIDRYINIGFEEGREEGREETLVHSVKALMDNLHISAVQAMKMLNISEQDQNKLNAEHNFY